MLSRRAFTSRLMAAPFGAAFALGLPACSKRGAYKISREDETLLRMDASALGRNMSVIFDLTDQDRAERLCDAIMARMTALDAVFSLDNPDSELSRLNREGHLDTPSDYLLALNQFAREITIGTGGAFNIAAAPITALYVQGGQPDPESLAAALIAAQGYALPGRFGLKLSRDDMQLDFKTCLTGFTADIIKAQLTGADIRSALINTGSFAAIGTRSDGRPWSIDISAPDAMSLPLDGAGLSSESFAQDGFMVDPRQGQQPALYRNVIVTADRAVLADALSSAFSLMPMAEITARRKALLAGGLSARLDVHLVNRAGQQIAVRG
ncbi:FAD:protein FMN transferase [Robiginitomaculum antarcticum]|uniref:FAD:protein FMN transferase n=1 Tax=Robiginitomaculum antarcticum TaxID=437507 RepID=UPI0003A69D79|nr:FAD:protein FMN transferase [Robiginitomaculum antarcticum]